MGDKAIEAALWPLRTLRTLYKQSFTTEIAGFCYIRSAGFPSIDYHKVRYHVVDGGTTEY